jgi:hypothetical protein
MITPIAIVAAVDRPFCELDVGGVTWLVGFELDVEVFEEDVAEIRSELLYLT